MRTEPARRWAATFARERRRALLGFWLRLLGGLAAVALLAIVYPWHVQGWLSLGVLLGPGLVIAVPIVAFARVRAARAELKPPLLEAMAAQDGLSFCASGFDSPLDAVARQLLFGCPMSEEHYSDLLYGHDPDGHAFAVYDAVLVSGSGRTRRVFFRGQIYTYGRASASQAQTVVRRDRILFNRFVPAHGYQRLKIDSDPEFERALEAYSTHPVEARRLLTGTALARGLVRLRRDGHVSAYVGPQMVALAVGGKDKFEVGPLFRRIAPRKRARRMFDEVAQATMLLGEMRRVIG